MRKIEKAMLSAIADGRDFHRDNTDVFWYTDVDDGERFALVYLHENVIAEVYPQQGAMNVYDAGWRTVTTRSRLNALLTMCNVQVRQNCKGHMSQPHLHDCQWFYSQGTSPMEYRWTGDHSFFIVN